MFIIAVVYVRLQLFLAARAANYSYLCQPVDYSDDPNEVRVSVFLKRGSDMINCSVPMTVAMTIPAHGKRNMM